MENNLQKVSDLGLATILLTLRFELVDLVRADEKRVHFVFRHGEGFDKAVSDYWAGIEIPISVQSLFANQKTLKNRLYALK